MAKPSIYPKEYRDQMAKECYEQLLENKTTIYKFAKENNINRKNLWSWINSRYYKTESEISTSSFVKIEKAPVNIVRSINSLERKYILKQMKLVPSLHPTSLSPGKK